jgi:hypothetical protein
MHCRAILDPPREQDLEKIRFFGCALPKALRSERRNDLVQVGSNFNGGYAFASSRFCHESAYSCLRFGLSVDTAVQTPDVSFKRHRFTQHIISYAV